MYRIPECFIPWKDIYAMLAYSVDLVDIGPNNLDSIKHDDALSLYNSIFNELMNSRIRNGLNHSYSRQNIVTDKVTGTINIGYTLNHSLLGNNKVAVKTSRHTFDTIENRIINRGYTKLKELNNIYTGEIDIELDNFDSYFIGVSYLTDDEILNINEYEFRADYISIIKLCKLIIDLLSYNDESTYKFEKAYADQINFNNNFKWLIYENFVREILKRELNVRVGKRNLARTCSGTAFPRLELDVLIEIEQEDKIYACIIDTKCYKRILSDNNKVSPDNVYQMFAYNAKYRDTKTKENKNVVWVLGIIMYARTNEYIPSDEELTYVDITTDSKLTNLVDIQALDTGYDNVKKSIINSVKSHIKQYLNIEL